MACKRIQRVPLSAYVSLILTDDLQIQRTHKLTFGLCSKESHLFALLSLVLREVTPENPQHISEITDSWGSHLNFL